MYRRRTGIMIQYWLHRHAVSASRPRRRFNFALQCLLEGQPPHIVYIMVGEAELILASHAQVSLDSVDNN